MALRVRTSKPSARSYPVTDCQVGMRCHRCNRRLLKGQRIHYIDGDRLQHSWCDPTETVTRERRQNTILATTDRHLSQSCVFCGHRFKIGDEIKRSDGGIQRTGYRHLVCPKGTVT